MQFVYFQGRLVWYSRVAHACGCDRDQVPFQNPRIPFSSLEVGLDSPPLNRFLNQFSSSVEVVVVVSFALNRSKKPPESEEVDVDVGVDEASPPIWKNDWIADPISVLAGGVVELKAVVSGA